MIMSEPWEKTKEIKQRLNKREFKKKKEGIMSNFSLWDSIGVSQRCFLKGICTVSYFPSSQRSASLGGLYLPLN